MNAEKLLIVKNSATEGPGIIEAILKEKSISYEIVELDKGSLFPSPKNYSAVIVLGGPDSANDTTIKMKHELEKEPQLKAPEQVTTSFEFEREWETEQKPEFEQEPEKLEKEFVSEKEEVAEGGAETTN